MLPGDDGMWYEGKPARDVVIRDNTFIDVDLGRIGPAIGIAAMKKSNGDPGSRYHHGNIAVLDNHFTLLNSLMVEATSVDGLLLRGNTLAQSKNFPAAAASPEYSLEHVRCVRFIGKDTTLKADDISQKDAQLIAVEALPDISAKPETWQAGCSQFTQKWSSLKP